MVLDITQHIISRAWLEVYDQLPDEAILEDDYRQYAAV
jgi:hypothetical protein